MAESMKERLRSDLDTARRARDKLRLLVLTTTLSEVRNREIELGREVGDADVLEVVQRAIKRRREAAEQARAGHREDLAVKEEAELAMLSNYLPPQLGADEVRELVRAAIAGGAQSMGQVMGKIAGPIKGRFDGKEASRIVREELESGG